VGKEPLHSIVASRAEARIRSGEWAPGTRLPPERELCRVLDISRATLRQALAELEQRGLITRHQGRGTFVTRPPVAAEISGFFTVAAALRARGMQLATRVLAVEIEDASRQLAQDLGCLPGDPLLRLDRLRLVESEPLMVDSTWLPLARFPRLEAHDFAGRSLYDILREDYGCELESALESFEPVVTTPREAHLLGVPRHAPALLLRRVAFDSSGVPVEMSNSLLRGDRSRFLLERRYHDVWVAEPGEPAGGEAAASGRQRSSRDGEAADRSGIDPAVVREALLPDRG
jgi:GntR family transcriptional regulator